jgi:pre-rRNA-processing protein IPI3
MTFKKIATGVLYRSFDAHYKRISALRFTDDDTALVSASDDASVNVWLLTKLLDEQEDITVAPSPYYSWSDHSLPVTDIVCGTGTFGSARIWTSSLDHTVKVGKVTIYIFECSLF